MAAVGAEQFRTDELHVYDGVAPDVQIIIRGDLGFCRDNIMFWCESNGVDYVFGLAKNEQLTAELAAELVQAKEQYEQTGKAARVFRDFTYSKSI